MDSGGFSDDYVQKLETTLRKIRGLAFKSIRYKKGFVLAVKMASEILNVSVPKMSGQNGSDVTDKARS